MGTLLSISLLSSLVLALCYITYKCFLASDKVCSLQSICFAVGISGGICHTCLVDHEAFRTFSESIDKKAVGVRFPSLANSLNHSQLKKRVNMMYKKSSSKWSRLRSLALVPAVVVAVAVFSIPVASMINEVSETDFSWIGYKVSEKASDDHAIRIVGYKAGEKLQMPL